MTEAEIFCQTNQMQETNETIDMLSQMLNSMGQEESTSGELEIVKKKNVNDNKIGSTVALGKEIKIYQ